ncbi:MAG: arginine repressor [Planctomycetes bacterium]|nr:arginine repressor [Planctomycetota bacterium]
MPRTEGQSPDRAVRLRFILTLVRNERISGQEELATRLRDAGHTATQPSVSRDLRELGVAKVKGVYRIADGGEPGSGQEFTQDLQDLVVSVTPAGPHLLVIHTQVGAASRCALAIDKSSLLEVVGTIAGDDTVFVACGDRNAQRRLQNRLRQMLKETL